jgi:hypothetical protein
MNQNHDAAEALVTISTLSREVPYSKIKELVCCVLQCPMQRNSLPVLIMLLRNHSKSLAPGVGSGEKAIPLKLICALFEEDAPMAVALLKDLVLYGSWASLLQLLAYIDLIGLETVGGHYHPSSDHHFNALQTAIYQHFAKQLQADESSVANQSGVSNASKFVPHEGRGGFNNFHGDRIAQLLFPNTAPHLPADARKHTLRKLFRQLRAKLNSSNNHIAEVSSLKLNLSTVAPLASFAPFSQHSFETSALTAHANPLSRRSSSRPTAPTSSSPR